MSTDINFRKKRPAYEKKSSHLLSMKSVLVPFHELWLTFASRCPPFEKWSAIMKLKLPLHSLHLQSFFNRSKWIILQNAFIFTGYIYYMLYKTSFWVAVPMWRSLNLDLILVTRSCNFIATGSYRLYWRYKTLFWCYRFQNHDTQPIASLPTMYTKQVHRSNARIYSENPY